MKNLLVQNQHNKCVYVLRKLDLQLAPMVVGLVQGPLIEAHFPKGLFMSQRKISALYNRAI